MAQTAILTTTSPSQTSGSKRSPSLGDPISVRLAARSGVFTDPTAGLAPGYLQANLLILPSAYAAYFRTLCQRNPVPCPLLAESSEPGNFSSFRSYIPGVGGHELFLLGKDGKPSIDIRTDIPRYNVYSAGKLVHCGVTDICSYWTSDSVAFLIGCSFSFEGALVQAGLTPRHIEVGQNCPMYRTNIPLCPAGVFQGGKYVVSMRPYKRRDIEKVRDITRAYGITHGEPIDWGWDAVQRLGISDIDLVDWGEPAVSQDGKLIGEMRKGRTANGTADDADEEEVPVFWGCGVTPQEAVMRAGKSIDGIVIGHMPGHMLLMDVRDDKILT